MAWHKCATCGKRFAFLKSLEDHQRTHLNAATFKCEVCGDQFRVLAAYQSHLNERHRGGGEPPPPSSQDEVDLSYSLADDEDAGEHKDDTAAPPPFKGFKCDTCTKRYSTAASLERHHQRKHPSRAITCSQEKERYHIKDYKLGRSLIIARTVQ